jgi:hypothetical protein
MYKISFMCSLFSTRPSELHIAVDDNRIEVRILPNLVHRVRIVFDAAMYFPISLILPFSNSWMVLRKRVNSWSHSSFFGRFFFRSFYFFVIRQLGVSSCGTQPRPKADLSPTIPPMARSFWNCGYLWLFGLYRIDAISVFVFISL